MLRVSRLLMKAKEPPQAFANGMTGGEPSPQRDPTKLPGVKSPTSEATKPLASRQANSPESEGPVIAPIVTNRSWEVTLWTDQDAAEALNRILQASSVGSVLLRPGPRRG
jgi:hypothetical protein